MDPKDIARTTMLLDDKISAVNAYADYLASIPQGQLPFRDPIFRALRSAAQAVIAETDDWKTVDGTNPRNILLETPAGEQVWLSADIRSIERLRRN